MMIDETLTVFDGLLEAGAFGLGYLDLHHQLRNSKLFPAERHPDDASLKQRDEIVDGPVKGDCLETE